MNTTEVASEIYHQAERLRSRFRNAGLTMIPCLMDTAIVSCDKDLKRFEEYHKSDNSEPHKQAAFLVYWISKIKPISIPYYNREDKYLYMNEYFAFMVAMKLLNIRDARISNAFMEDFIYTLYFRDASPRQMFYTFKMLDELNRIAPTGTVIM